MSVGTWQNTPTAYSPRWQRQDPSGAFADIPGALGFTYTPVDEDIGRAVRVVVTAVNAAGSSQPASSAPSAPVAAAQPAGVGAPTIAGTGRQGLRMVASPGTWTDRPDTFAYRWWRCDRLALACSDTRASGPEYTPNGLDVGHALRVVVTATNAAGSGTATSALTAVVTGHPTVRLLAPLTIARARGRATLLIRVVVSDHVTIRVRVIRGGRAVPLVSTASRIGPARVSAPDARSVAGRAAAAGSYAIRVVTLASGRRPRPVRVVVSVTDGEGLAASVALAARLRV